MLRRNAQTPHADVSPAPRDCAYVIGYNGFIYAGVDLSSDITVRHSATLLLSCDHAAFTVGLSDGRFVSGPALLVPPMVQRTLQASGVPLLSFNVMPSHASFHTFSALQRSGVMVLDRHAFDAFDDAMHLLLAGDLPFALADLLFEQAVGEAQRQLPPAPPPDPSALQLIRLLDENPHLNVDDLARMLGRSTQAVSRLFSSTVGMSARDYQGWLRLRRMHDLLYTPRSLTDVAYAAGFSDSPQLSRSYQRWYGKTPSFARDPKRVRVFIRGAESGQPPQEPGCDAAPCPAVGADGSGMRAR